MWRVARGQAQPHSVGCTVQRQEAKVRASRVPHAQCLAVRTSSGVHPSRTVTTDRAGNISALMALLLTRVWVGMADGGRRGLSGSAFTMALPRIQFVASLDTANLLKALHGRVRRCPRPRAGVAAAL